MFVHSRRLIGFTVVAGMIMIPRAASAQTSTFDACSQSVLVNCARIRLTSQLGAGTGGTNLFQIAVDNLGSQTAPSLPTSIYQLVLLTGQAAFDTEIDAVVTPGAEGGAIISDPAGWSITDFGDVIFISSAPANSGIGGCAVSPPVGTFAQMAQTCGDDAFVTFSYSTPSNIDPGGVSIADVEFAMADGNGDSCSDACTVTKVTSTPEPSTIVLALTGLTGIAGMRRRRKTANTAAMLTVEA